MIRVNWTDYPERSCVVCGKMFKPKNKNHKTCSEECRKVQKQQKYASEKHNALYKLKCRNCGKTFKHFGNKKRYCSDACKKEYHQKSKNFTFTPTKKKPDPNQDCLHCTWFTPCGGQKGFCMFPTCAKERMKTNAYN